MSAIIFFFVIVSVQRPPECIFLQFLLIQECLQRISPFYLKKATRQNLEKEKVVLMSEKLTKLFLAMVKSTIGGHESGFYKMSGEPAQIVMVPALTVSFYNHVHDSLAGETDCKDGCASKIKAMQDCTGHSPICLLNLLCFMTMVVHLSLEHGKLDCSNYQAFMTSLEQEIDSRLEEKTKDLAQQFDHKCKGPQKVTPLPPGQKMFYVNGEKK